MTLILLFCAISYFVGSLPFGLWIGLVWKGVDIRTLGSKNIGATNALRVLGTGPGVVAFVLDTFKGYFGIALAATLWSLLSGYHTTIPDLTMPYKVLIGVSAVLGHTFSIFLRFKGGKGIATSFGLLIALNYWVALIALLSWLLPVLITRYVSLGSLVAAYSLPFSAYFLLQGVDRAWMLWMGVALAILVTVKHRANIARLLDGTEAKIGQRVKSSTETAEAR